MCRTYTTIHFYCHSIIVIWFVDSVLGFRFTFLTLLSRPALVARLGHGHVQARGATVMQWWEHSPLTPPLVRVQIQEVTSYVGWFWCDSPPCSGELFSWYSIFRSPQNLIFTYCRNYSARKTAVQIISLSKSHLRCVKGRISVSWPLLKLFNHQMLEFFLKSFARNNLHFVIAELLTLLLLESIRLCCELGAAPVEVVKRNCFVANEMMTPRTSLRNRIL